MTNLSPPPFRLGDMEIRRVMEMQFPFLPAGRFLPDATDDALAPLRTRFEPWALEPGTAKLIVAIQAYVVKTARHTILIDACVGCEKSSHYDFWDRRTDRGWMDRLIASGTRPEEITHVFCTHLHGDHIGWCTELVGGRFVPTFPNARYIFARREVEHVQAAAPHRRAAYEESVLPVIEAGQADLVETDHQLDDGVWIAPSPGHTPGHVTVHLRSRGEEAAMVGDMIHSPIQLARPGWSTAVDVDGAEAARTRRRFLETSLAENRLVMTAHFPAPSVGRVRAGAEGDLGPFGFDFSPDG